MRSGNTSHVPRSLPDLLPELLPIEHVPAQAQRRRPSEHDHERLGAAPEVPLPRVSSISLILTPSRNRESEDTIATWRAARPAALVAVKRDEPRTWAANLRLRFVERMPLACERTSLEHEQAIRVRTEPSDTALRH